MRILSLIYSPPFLTNNFNDILGKGNGASGSGTQLVEGSAAGILKLIGLIILCALIIAASYFTTKFVGKKQLKTQTKSNFKSIDIYRLSTNKYLQIIAVGKKYYLISVCKDSVSVLGEMTEEDIINWPPEEKNVSFKDIMSKIKKKNEETDDNLLENKEK